MGQKDSARQIRKVAEHIVDNIVNPAMNTRLDAIDKYCRETLDKADQRAKAVQGFIVGEVKNVIQGMIEENNVTITALVDILVESNIVPDLAGRIEAQKATVRARMKADAIATMEKRQADLKAAAEKAAADKAAAAAAQESSPTQQ